jgi:ankyrin repeat protein
MSHCPDHAKLLSVLDSSTEATPLHFAAFSGCVEAVRFLTDQHPPLRLTPDAEGALPLHKAAFNGHEAAARELLRPSQWEEEDGGAAEEVVSQLSVADSGGALPLHLAAFNGHVSVVPMLAGVDESVEGGEPDALTQALCVSLDVDGFTPLHLAAAQNHAAVVRSLATVCRMDPNTKAADFAGAVSALHRAVRTKAKDAVEALIEVGADVLAVDRHGNTPVHFAAYYNRRGLLPLLLKQADPAVLEARTRDGSTPFLLAVRRGHWKTARVLLDEYQVAADATLDDGGGALHVAARRKRNVELVTAMIKDGRSPLFTDARATDNGGRIPLHYAAAADSAEIVSYLLRGSDARELVDVADKEGQTPLHLAAAEDARDGVGALVRKGANIDAVDATGRTPLHLAAAQARVKSVRRLLDKGARPDIVSTEGGHTALHEAALSGEPRIVEAILASSRCSTEVVRQLTATGEDALGLAATGGHERVITLLLTKCGAPSHAALRAAAGAGRMGTVSALLEAGAPVSAKPREEDAALAAAAASGHARIVETLLERGADASHRNAAGVSAAHEAAGNGFEDCLRKLRKAARECVTLVDDEGNTPLHWSARAGSVLCSTYLMDCVDPTIQNKKGQSARDVASMADAQEVVALLELADMGSGGSKVAGASSAASGSRAAERGSVRRPDGPADAAAKRVFDALSSVSKTEVPPAMRPLLSRIFHRRGPALPALLRATEVAEADRASVALLDVFEAAGESLFLLRAAIDVEIQRATTPSTLFRQNSLSSKLLTRIALRHGSTYLHVLIPIFQRVNQLESAIEVDPNRLMSGHGEGGEGSEMAANQEALLSLTSDVLSVLTSNAHQVPALVRAACHHLRDRVDAKEWEGADSTVAVGGFIFLRWINPAIVAPDGGSQLVPRGEVSAPARRTLLLVSKILNAMANNVEFGGKEAWLTFANSYLAERRPEVRSFLESLATFSDTLVARALTPQAPNGAELIAASDGMRRHLSYSRDRIRREIAEVDEEASIEFDALLAALGEPPPLHAPTKAPVATGRGSAVSSSSAAASGSAAQMKSPRSGVFGTLRGKFGRKA